MLAGITASVLELFCITILDNIADLKSKSLERS